MKYNHIVVCGFKRSGTTLLYNMLRYSLEGYKFFDQETHALRQHKGDPHTPKVTKKPQATSRIKQLRHAIPNIAIIMCIRDPRDIIVSKLSKISDTYHVGWDNCLKVENRQKVIGLNKDGIQEDHTHCKNALHYKPFTCYYEDLVYNPTQMQERICNYLGVRASGNFSDFHQEDVPWRLATLMNGVRPVDTTSVGKWRHHPERIYTQFTKHPQLFNIVKYWGYENEDSWFLNVKEQVKHNK